MTRLVRRWPPALWIAVYVASVLILMGGRGRLDLLVVGGALAITACGAAVWAALRRWPGHPRPRPLVWAIGGVVAFYAVCALAAGLALGLSAALVALAAGVIPLTAVALLAATVRTKTVETDDGRVRDLSADDDSPYPGFGMDDRVARRATRSPR